MFQLIHIQCVASLSHYWLLLHTCFYDSPMFNCATLSMPQLAMLTAEEKLTASLAKCADRPEYLSTCKPCPAAGMGNQGKGSVCMSICLNAGGPLGWLYPSEIQPLETRSAGQGIATLVNLLFSFVIGQTYLSMLCSFKVSRLPAQPYSLRSM